MPFVKNSSPCTQKNYKLALSLYLKYLEDVEKVTQESLSFSCFEEAHIEGWIKWLETERKCCPSSCNTRLSSLRSFIQYLNIRDISLGYLQQQAAMIPNKKTGKNKVKGLSRDSVKALMDAPDTSTPTGRRDIALLVTLYASATRIEELLSLKVKHVYLEVEKPYITVVGKGSKIRTLYLLPRAVDHIKCYLEEFHPNKNQDDILFFSKIKGRHTPLTQAAVAKQLKKYAKIAHEKCNEVPLDLHAHQFRHAKASHWLEDGMNILQISFLLGHASVNTTMVYLDITTEQEEKALATLETELEQKMTKKWKGKENSLLALCGLL